jgi:O-antigen ligase
LAGAFLVQALALSPVWTLLRAKRLGMVLAISQGALLFLLLVATGSRGAWIALLVLSSWASYSSIRRGEYRRLLGFFCVALVLMGIGVALYPMAWERVSRLIHDGFDSSTQFRLTLWKSALILAIDHPWTGVGDFDTYFSYWYATPDMQGLSSPTAISDPLNCAAVYGLPALFVGILCIGFAMAGLLSRTDDQGDEPHLLRRCLFALLVAWLVSGCFSCIAFHFQASALAYFAILVGFSRVLHVRMRSSMATVAICGSVLVAIVCAGILIDSAGRLPRRVFVGDGMAWASSARGKGHILVSGSGQDSLQELTRGVGNTIVASGWDVTLISHGCRDIAPGVMRDTFDAEIVFHDGERHGRACRNLVLVDVLDAPVRGAQPENVMYVDRELTSDSTHLGIRTTRRTWPHRFPLYWGGIESWLVARTGDEGMTAR